MLKEFREMCWSKLFQGKSAAWTALSTVVLAGLTFELAAVNMELKDLQRIYVDTTITSQRAFVNLNASPGPSVKLRDQSLNKDVGIQVPIGWVNSGTTPAKLAVGVSNFQPSITPLSPTFEFKDLTTSQPNFIVIGPKDIVKHNLAIPIGHFVDVMERKYHLYLWGWLAYRDVLPNTPIRLTEFCVEFLNIRVSKPDTQAGGGTSGEKTDQIHASDIDVSVSWDVFPCTTVSHNCYDEGCSDYQTRVKEIADQFPQLR